MFIGNTCYVTEGFNEKKYKAVFEEELHEVQKKRSKTELSHAFIEHSISAMLACKDQNSFPQTVIQMEKFLYTMGIKYEDNRPKDTKTDGSPIEAVKAFIILASKLSDRER